MNGTKPTSGNSRQTRQMKVKKAHRRKKMRKKKGKKMRGTRLEGKREENIKGNRDSLPRRTRYRREGG